MLKSSIFSTNLIVKEQIQRNEYNLLDIRNYSQVNQNMTISKVYIADSIL